MDIKLTLAAGAKIRSPSIEAEARWIEDNGPIYYGLPTKPRDANAGDYIYFLRDGSLSARAKIDKVVSGREVGDTFSYTGEQLAAATWYVVVSSMELSPHRLRQKGFQGYRYVGQAESRRFQNAFRRSTSHALGEILCV